MCKSKLPKADNTNTPVRAAAGGVTTQRGAAASQFDISMGDQPHSLIDNLNETAHNMTIEVTDVQSLFIELRSFRDEMREELRAARTDMKRLTDSLSAVAGRITDCENRMDALTERLDRVERRTTEKENKLTQHQCSIEELKLELNNRDQQYLLTELEISNIPETLNESLLHVVKALAVKLDVSLEDQDIVSVVRVGRDPGQEKASETADIPRSSRPRVIAVRLARRAVRDEMLQSARVRRGATTEGLELAGKPQRFYINERLTRSNRQLFGRARELGKRLGWRYVWTRDGRVYARQYPGKDVPRFRLRTDDDLGRVFGLDAVRSENHSL